MLQDPRLARSTGVMSIPTSVLDVVKLLVIDTGHKFLFIGGLHRSGTSLLHRCITDHPEVSGFSETGAPKNEGQHLQDVYPPAPTFGGPGIFGFDSSSYLDEDSQLANKENAEELFAQWSKHWDLSKPILVEKSPPNLVRARFLQALFPETHFVMIVRHPIAVSYATRKWTDLLGYLSRRIVGRELRPYLPTIRLPIWLLIKHWVVCHERSKKDSEKIRSLLTVKYENLVEDTICTFEKIWKFIGVEPFDLNREVKCKLNRKYLYKWRKLTRRRDAVGNFYSGYVFREYEDRVRKFGYSLGV